MTAPDGPAADPATGTAADPAADSAAHPATDPAADSAAHPATDPAAEPATPPARPWAFEYSVLRIVPRVDRGEQVNGAVLLYCQQAGFLGIRLRPDLHCVRALWPEADVEAIAEALGVAEAAVAGRTRVGRADPGSRFRWLTAPRSAVVQPGPVHTGVTGDPEAELERIAHAMLGP